MDRPELLPEAHSPTSEDPVDEEPDPGGQVTERFHRGALRVMEEGPYAPQCPHGHGRLVPAVDHAVSTGVSLSCPTCGFRRDLEVNLQHNPAPSGPVPSNPAPSSAPRHASSAPPEQPTVRLTASAPRHAADATHTTTMWPTQDHVRDDAAKHPAPEPTRPRGRKPDGTVRTCSQVQVHGWVMPAGLWSPVLGLLVGLALTGGRVWWSLVLAAAGYGLWWSATQWVWPCSPTINRQRVHPGQLQPGMWIRLYGRFGPVGRVEHITTPKPDTRTDGDLWVRIGFAEGTFLDLPSHALCTVVDLRG